MSKSALTLCLLILLTSLATGARADHHEEPGAEDMAAMMAKAEKFTKPGENHAFLNKFLGQWNTALQITMPGMETSPEKGTAEFKWLMDGRWMEMHSDGSMMGMPMRMFSLMGYDNNKMSYVVTSVSTFDTAMTRAEGDVDPATGSLILYGTLDEYLTGEHDKMVKVAWRFHSDDKMVMEVHDFPIGEENNKVFEIVYTRKAK